MGFFARAVVTGFAMALGSALFKKVAPQLGLADDKDKKDGKTGDDKLVTPDRDGDGSPDPIAG